MRRFVFVIALVLTSPAFSADITVTYTQEEAQQAIGLYNDAVKADGLSAAPAALALTKKLQDAFAAAQQQSTPPAAPPNPATPPAAHN